MSLERFARRSSQHRHPVPARRRRVLILHVSNRQLADPMETSIDDATPTYS
jgi:hypothetical protein